MLQVGQGDQLVQVAQAGLVFCQYDQVLGPALDLSAPLPPQLGHIGVDFRQVAQPHALHPSEEVGQHIGHRGRVVAGPVVVEGGQMQMLRHHVQLVPVQLGQKVLGQNQAVNGGIFKGNPILLAPGGDKAHVKIGVVGGQGPVPGKGQKGPQGLLL